jgi:hypothetical protein
VQGSVKLEEDLDTISDYWPVTTPLNPKHLHIVVELPSRASCFPSLSICAHSYDDVKFLMAMINPLPSDPV